MNKRVLILRIGLLVFILVAGAAVWSTLARGANSSPGNLLGTSPGTTSHPEGDEALEKTMPQDPMILSYAAKFVCMQPLLPGTLYYGPVAPIVLEQTGVLIHNPHDFPVTFYKKAVLATTQTAPPSPPGPWHAHTLEPDFAIREDCDGITQLLTGDPSATFVGTFGIGVEVEGFVVIGVGPQVDAAGLTRYAPLDVTAEYVRSSEVFKKDISYQPWWWWWWWPLPWQLGYAYERLVPITPGTNIDCKNLLYTALHEDVEAGISDPQMKALTHQALSVGQNYDPRTITQFTNESPPALVAMIGNCNKLDANTADIDYILLSNKGMTDPDPRGIVSPESGIVLYPWYPGRWYDLAVVMPQNYSVDLNQYMVNWQSQRWIDAGGDPLIIQQAMIYYFPWSCGWGYWWWWWGGEDCIDIAVGEGESLDVEQITPVRVFMAQWPPVTENPAFETPNP
ncbi:MAG: hypothetical protein Fur0022_49210 [Anaerolineales bacterium]